MLKSITLKLATADGIHDLLNGEVTVAATFDDNGLPVGGGLFDRAVFGADGKQFGHIELAFPVVHPWYESVARVLTGTEDLSDGQAVLEALRSVDLTAHVTEDEFVRRCVEALIESGVPAEAMVLRALPVVPPAVRPLVQMAGGGSLSSDLNELYQRVIARNNALRDLLAKSASKAPAAYVKDARDRLADAVRALIGGAGEQGALQSLTDLLAGPNGLLKRNLQGKRVDYSGRSVIVSGPDLRLDQCGIPAEMALEQFKPFVARKMVESGAAASAQEALDVIALKPKSREVRRALEAVATTHLVLLNRAPTLHRLGIQPFRPVLVDHRAIELHPLTCYEFNADFDGDQMAVHVPISGCAQAECEELLDSAVNLVSPANGSPITGPVQDIVLGLWYLTAPASHAEPVEARSAEEIADSVASGALHPHAPVVLSLGDDAVETTAGRALFNASLPAELGFVNEQTGKGQLRDLVARCLAECGRARTRETLDGLNRLGLAWVTRYAPSYGLGVVPDSAAVTAIREEAERRERDLLAKRRDSEIDSESFDKQIWDMWADAVNDSQDAVRADLSSAGSPISAMLDSGARGSWAIMAPSFGVTGMVWHDSAAQGTRQRFEAGVLSNYWEGLTPLEHFSKAFGARRGLVDTHIRSMDALSLMTGLIYAAQGVLITSDDCGTTEGIEVAPIQFDGRVMESLAARVAGRVAAADIVGGAGEIIVRAGDLVTKAQAAAIEKAGVARATIRSAITCRQERGACAKCYGEDPSYGEMVKPGTAVGVIAAQAVSEPATQLTLRTFYAARPPKAADQPRHPGGLKYLIDLLEGRRSELSPVEIVEEAERILRFQGVDVNDKHFETLARAMRPSRQTSVIGEAAVGDSQRVLALAAVAGAKDNLDNALERIVAGLAPHYHGRSPQ